MAGREGRGGRTTGRAGGGGGSGLGALLSQYFGSDVAYDPDKVAAAKNLQAHPELVEQYPAADYSKLTAPGASTEPFEAKNWLSKFRANTLNQQAQMGEVQANTGVDAALKQAQGMLPITKQGQQNEADVKVDAALKQAQGMLPITKQGQQNEADIKADAALKQAQGMLPITKQDKQNEADIKAGYERQLTKILADRKSHDVLLDILGRHDLNPNDPEAAQSFFDATKEPNITEAAAIAGARGNEAALAGQRARVQADTETLMEPEIKTAQQNAARQKAFESQLDLNTLDKSYAAKLRGLVQKPDIDLLNAQKNQYYPVPAGNVVLNSSTGQQMFRAPDRTDRMIDFAKNGGAALLNGLPTTTQQPSPLSPQPTAPLNTPQTQYIRTKDGYLVDPRTGKRVLDPFANVSSPLTEIGE